MEITALYDIRCTEEGIVKSSKFLEFFSGNEAPILHWFHSKRKSCGVSHKLQGSLNFSELFRDKNEGDNYNSVSKNI